MPKKVRELLFQLGLVLAAIVVGKWLDSPFGYVIAAILAIAFITQWLLQREEGEREVEMERGLFGGHIPSAEHELPEVRPKIVPVDYCKAEKHDFWGLHMRNSGYDALDVEISDVPVGHSGYTLEFPGRLAQLGERSGIGFLEAWLKHGTLPGLDGSQLHKVMREADVESVYFSIVYKDTDLRPKKTECAIERTNRARHGLLVRATSAPGIPALSAPQSPIQANVPVGRDWPREWRDQAQAFASTNSTVRADWHDTSAGRGWRICGGGPEADRQMEVLCKLAGNLLVKSPHVLSKLSEEIKSEANPAWRWLCYFKGNNIGFKYDIFPGPIFETLDDGTKRIAKLGSISNLATVSAQQCLDFAGQEY